MALSDYWKGPEHRRRADDLDLQLTDLQARYQQLQALTRQIGAMEVVEVKNLIAQEKRKLAAVHQEVQCSGQLIPDTVLSFSSALAGASPSLN